MNEVWNLSVIYDGFQDPSYEADLSKLKERSAAYAERTAALAGTDPLEGLKKGTRLMEELFMQVRNGIEVHLPD